METFNLIVNNVSFEVSKDKLDTLYEAGVVKLSSDSTFWELNEESEHYEVAMALLHIGEEG